MERQNLKVRRRLAAAVGGWNNLPEVNFDLWRLGTLDFQLLLGLRGFQVVPGRCATGGAPGGDLHDPHLEEHGRRLLGAEHAAGPDAEPQGVRGGPGESGLLQEPAEEDLGEGEASEREGGGGRCGTSGGHLQWPEERALTCG